MRMIRFRPLPWDYGVRNLFRRPSRSFLTLGALTLVVFLVMVVVSFIRGLDESLAASGDSRAVLIHSLGASENIENSTIPGNAADLLRASLSQIQSRHGQSYVSPELYLGTEVRVSERSPVSLGIIRGVLPQAALVHSEFQLLEGDWPKAQELLIGRLAATKLGTEHSAVEIGKELIFEGARWRIAGSFAAGGSPLESEMWCRLEDVQQVTTRQDLTLVAMVMRSSEDVAAADEFCKERLDLEWEATPETDYYAALQRHYRPVRTVSWLVVALVGSAGAFAGLNTMYGSVVGRVREIAALQTIGFLRRAIVLSIMQEAVLLSSAGALLAAAAAISLVHGVAIRFTMGAFQLRVDHITVAVGLLTGILIGVIGAIPPAVRAMRMPVAEAIKAI